MTVKSQPEGIHTVTPYLSVRGAAAAIDFYRRAFGAEEVFRLDAGNGLVGHAEIRIGDSVILLADELGGSPQRSPSSLAGTSVAVRLFVDDVDACFARALAAGGVQLRGVADQFYGDRNGALRDPFGHVWIVGTHIEDLTPEQIAARMQALRVVAG
ncbi:MAG: VOC family protein [Pseudomonadales bacterium]|jgi:PhnB protein|nr:VOC family protein [Pseudomonadales bacterium]MBP9033255.1 VOC family protein [Pseudomonadales bacterium]